MTDLAQKIAAMLVDKGYVMPHEQYEAAHAIRTALPVAQGEAVTCIKGLPSSATHFAATETVGHAWGRFPTCIRAFKYVDGELQVFSTDSDNDYPRWEPASALFTTLPPVFPLYAAPPASRIAELEREVKYLRAAMRRAEVHLESYSSAFALDTLQIALAAQEKK